MDVDHEYPVALGISFLFICGYVLRSLFVALGLPASVGVMLSGFSFSYIAQDEIVEARDEIQELAFFIVLLIAGLEIRLSDLKPYIFVMAWMPASLEIAGIAICAHFVLDYAPQEAIIIGTVLVALGDGLVIPKMKEFGMRFPRHPLPRLVFIWCPLEASFVLTLFGVFTGIAAPANMQHADLKLIVLANLLRIVATVLCGALLGAVSGWLIPRRVQLRIGKAQVFNGAPVEAFLMVLAVTLFAFALGKGKPGHELVPMGFCSGSLFQPELMVIITGTVFSYVTDPHMLHEIETLLGELWVFGGIILFSMLGSKTTTSILPKVSHVIPLWCAGVTFRFLGVLIGMLFTVKARGCKNRSTVLLDTLFCFLCTLPRATIQGALGAVPMRGKFFAFGYDNKVEVREFIFTAARLYIVCTAVCGMIMLNTFGPKILARTEEPEANSESNVQGADADSDMPLAGAGGAGEGEGAGVPHRDSDVMELVLLDLPADMVKAEQQEPPGPSPADDRLPAEAEDPDRWRLLELVAERYGYSAVDLEAMLLRGPEANGIMRTDQSSSSLGARKVSTRSEVKRHQSYRELEGEDSPGSTSSAALIQKTEIRRFRMSIGGLAAFDAPILRRSNTGGESRSSVFSPFRRVFGGGSENHSPSR